MEPSTEEMHILKEDTEDEGDEEDEGNKEDEEDEEDEEDDGVEESGEEDNETKDEQASPQTADELGEKKQSESLNLNNEVVKLRKEVKRVRALIIRKLTRQIGGLKKKKGKEVEIERNQRRAARLLEEIHAMKTLSPDVVTKTALRKNLNFELVCKHPKSTISDRAVARIATHPQFSKKIEAIKSAVKAFKDDRPKGGTQACKEKVQNKVKKVTPRLPGKEEEKEGEVTARPQKSKDEENVFKDPVGSTFIESEKEAVKESTPKNIKTATVKSVKDVKMKNRPQSKDKEKTPAPEPALLSEGDEEESELESSDEGDKQYFDDSTEERFNKQSSQSEESDGDNDFFIGKVSKFKKKKRKERTEAGTESQNGHETKGASNQEVKGKPEPKPKATSFQSIFCSSLTKSAGGRGAGRGREAFRGNSKGSRGMRRDFGKNSRFHKQEQDSERNSSTSKSDSSKKAFGSDSRGKGRGAHRGAAGFSHQAPQQALHPSWEASRKRKEQQGQIMAFQGKKIKFDDDDD